MLDVTGIPTHQVVVRGTDCVLEGDDVEDGEEFPSPVLTAGQTEGAEKEESYWTDLGHLWCFLSTENIKRNPQLLTVCFCQSVGESAVQWDHILCLYVNIITYSLT